MKGNNKNEVDSVIITENNITRECITISDIEKVSLWKGKKVFSNQK